MDNIKNQPCQKRRAEVRSTLGDFCQRTYQLTCLFALLLRCVKAILQLKPMRLLHSDCLKLSL